MLIPTTLTLSFLGIGEALAERRAAVLQRIEEMKLSAAATRLVTPAGSAAEDVADSDFAVIKKADGQEWTTVLLQGLLDVGEAAAVPPDVAARAKLRANVPIGPADLWTPYSFGGGLFGDRRRALALIGAPEEPDATAGEGVNVVILDYGLSDAWLQRWRGREDGRVAGGWKRFGWEGGRGRVWFKPGEMRPGTSEHGHMIARNILSLAPAARIWDVPLLPDTALGPPGLAMAEAIFFHIRRDIDRRRQGDTQLPSGPWILVNAWGALNPLPYDLAIPNQRYSDNPHHCFVEDMPKFSDRIIDVVFAAGNCGTPGAMPLCGESSVGPGASIHGVNAHPSVLTVGAVRVDGVPIGSSAQGPGMLARGWDPKALPSLSVPGRDDPRAKPDICAPSHFRETRDGALWNTGTSAACGIAAGMLARLRGEEVRLGLWTQDAIKPPRSPEAMRALLRESAGSKAWDPQLGWGVAHLGRALDALG
jgi:hypothetical protein